MTDILSTSELTEKTSKVADLDPKVPNSSPKAHDSSPQLSANTAPTMVSSASAPKLTPTASKTVDASVKKPDASTKLQEATSDTKKPSEIAKSTDPVQRETARPTDLPSPDEVLAKKAANRSTICCCIDPYVNEEPSFYVPGSFIRQGDVYRHRTTMVRQVVCFNLCWNTEFRSQNIITRAADGVVMPNITLDELNNINNYFLVKSEKCNHRHHDIRRYSNMGRILKFLFTPAGIYSTLRKLICLDECIDTVNTRTVRCERSHYSRRHF
jgi:hypothetical protein